MSYRNAARAVGVAALALLLPVLASTSASAAPSDSSNQDAATLAAMQRDFGLSAEAVEQRMAGEQAAARTDEALRSDLGNAYSGAYIDQATGQLVVRTSDPAAAESIEAAGAKAVVQAPGKDPKQTKEKLDKAAKKAAKSVGSWYVDQATGTVVVEATNTADAAAFVAASDAAPDQVQIKEVAEAPKLYAELIGGDAIYSSTSRCSLGFNGISGSGVAYVITAGHCTESGGNWSGFNRTTIGPVAASNFPSDDYGAIRVNSTQTWTPTSKVKGTSSVLGSTEAAVGASTCRSGSTTGFRCGTIQAKNSTVNYGGGDIVYGLTRTSACAEPGDSGGSFVAGRQAQGLTSGGSGNCSTGGTTYFQPINEALNNYGLRLVTG